MEETRLGDRAAHGAPLPAWADVGTASHLRGLSGVVPGGKSGRPDELVPRFQRSHCIFRSCVVMVSLLENLSCYSAYLECRAPDLSFYNKFEAHVIGMPGLDTSLLVCTVLNTVYLFLFWLIIAVLGLDLHDVLAWARLPLSLACCTVCVMLVCFAESTKFFAFLSTVCFLVYLEVLVCGFLRHQMGKKCQYFVAACAGFLFCCVVTWCLMFALDAMAFFRNKDCRATRNRAMPVRIEGLTDWQCVRWGEAHYISHVPNASEPVFDAYCVSTFHDLGKVPAVGAAPSSRAYYVRCPTSACQALGLGVTVVGCNVYDARSSMCSAAVQMGILPPDQGGVVKVVGRPPPDAGYERCSRNGVLSVTDAASSSVDREWAFYFQEAEGMREADMVTLHGWKKAGNFPTTKQPWESYTADVSWVLSGGAVQRREVMLGPPSGTGEVELNFCSAAGTSDRHACE